MVNDFITQEDLSLFLNGARFPSSVIYLQEGMRNTRATFDLFVRELPQKRNFLVFCGLEHVVDYLTHFRFTPKQLRWIKNCFAFSPKVMKYFKNFRFTGDMWAMPEGTVFFPQEPIIRITAPIIEAQMIEVFLMNTVYLQTLLASKIARFVHAAGKKSTVMGFHRCHGLDAAMKSTRVCQIFGVQTAMSLYSFKNNILLFPAGTSHALIMSFRSELDAFRAYNKHLHGRGYILIDTYNAFTGIKNFITAARELEKNGYRSKGIYLDSGNLYRLSVVARRMLDRAGLKYCKILVLSNLDEYKIADFEKRKAPIDVYGGATELLNSSDAPTLELVYKLSELESNGKRISKMKLSSKKVSLPGRKQVFRITSKGRYAKDILGLENEKNQGKKLLKPIIKNGKRVYGLPPLQNIGDYYKKEIKKFPEKIFSVTKKVRYPVFISPQLKKLVQKTKKQISLQHDIDAE